MKWVRYMSDGALPAGWYHGEGDPAGTHRYWDGGAWVGEPQLIEPAAATAQQPAAPAAQSGWNDQAAVPVDTANMGPVQWWLQPYKRYAEFSGRSRRAEYWWFALGNVVVQIALIILLIILGSIADILGVIGVLLWVAFGLGSLIPSWAVYIRRMHDTNHSGWWILVPLVPLIFALTDSDRGQNRYGASPKYQGY